jgi:hypothetical protein
MGAERCPPADAAWHQIFPVLGMSSIVIPDAAVLKRDEAAAAVPETGRNWAVGG